MSIKPFKNVSIGPIFDLMLDPNARAAQQNHLGEAHTFSAVRISDTRFELWLHDERTLGGVLINPPFPVLVDYNNVSMVLGANNTLTITQANGNVVTEDLSSLLGTDVHLASLTLVGNTMIATDTDANTFPLDLSTLAFVDAVQLVGNNLTFDFGDGSQTVIDLTGYLPAPDGVINSFTLAGTVASITTTTGQTFNLDFSRFDESLANNNDGTYTFNDGLGNLVLIDTRAGSNPYDATNFLVQTFQGNPVDDVQIALDALSALVSSLVQNATDILNNPTLYIRQATGNDANDGSTAALAFQTFAGMLTYVNNAYIIGNIIVDVRGQFPPVHGFTAAAFKGAGRVTLRGDPALPNNFTIEWSLGTGSFRDGLRVREGLNLKVQDLRFLSFGLRPFSDMIAVSRGSRLTMAGTIRLQGPLLHNNHIITADSQARIETPRSVAGVPSLVLDIDPNVNQSIRDLFRAQTGAIIEITDTQINLMNDVTLTGAVVVCEDGGIVRFTSGPSLADQYITNIAGPGNFVAEFYRLIGNGSAITNVRVPLLDYGIEPAFFRATINARFNGIGTYTQFNGQYRFGNLGTYHV